MEAHRGRNPERGSAVTPREFILLAGTGRPTPFTSAISRSVLDLPLAGGTSILDFWHRRAHELAVQLAGGPLGVRVVVDVESPLPTAPPHREGVDLRVERDPFEYRGTGGVLADLSRSYDDDEFLLVANATQVSLAPLWDPCRRLSERSAGVTLYDPGDGTPISLMLIRCSALRDIPEIGFVDLKEQALTEIAAHSGVEVVRGEPIAGRPIRTLDAYIRTVRDFLRIEEGGRIEPRNPFEETWRPTFSVVEEGAVVEPGAKVHDSVILAGGCMKAGSAAVRSIVCPGAVVKRNAVATELVVGRGGGKATAGKRPGGGA